MSMEATIRIANRLPELSTLEEKLTALLESGGASQEFIDDVILIAEELVTNTVSYGYEDEDEHHIEIEVSHSAGGWRFRFRDDAGAFNPLEAPPPDLEASERPIGGLGIHLVKELSDLVSYERSEGCNIITVEKKA